MRDRKEGKNATRKIGSRIQRKGYKNVKRNVECREKRKNGWVYVRLNENGS